MRMVKMPRQVKRYSPSAGKHTLHTVERVKKKTVALKKKKPLGSASFPQGHGRLPRFPPS